MQAVRDVISFTGAGYSESHGFLAYLPNSTVLLYAARTYPDYDSLKRNMKRAITKESGSSKPVIASLRVFGSVDDDDGKTFDVQNAIESYAYTKGGNVLKFRFKNEEVKITFINDTGCAAFAEIFSRAGISLQNY